MTDDNRFHDADTLVRVGFERPERRGSYRAEVGCAVRAASLKEAIDKACEQFPGMVPVEAKAVHLRWYDPAPFSNFYRRKNKPC